MISKNMSKLKEKDYDVLLYVFNAENISSTDNFNYLNYIFRNKKDNKIIFVINKLDSFRKGEDSIEDTVMNVNKELKKIGFTNKEIKKLLPEIEKNNIRSNVELEKIIGKERYKEIEDKIKFIE